MDLARKLLFLADKGDLQRQDDGCGVLYGIIRDAAYKMKQAAENEKQNHILQGTWDGEMGSDQKEDSFVHSPSRRPIRYIGGAKDISRPRGTASTRPG
jgi:hypothetical protein